LTASEEQARGVESWAKQWQDKHAALAEDHIVAQSSLIQITAERDSIRAQHDELASNAEATAKEIAQFQQLLSAASGEVKWVQQQLHHAQAEAAHAVHRAEDVEKMQQDLQAENVELMASLNEMRPKIVELTQDKLTLGEETERLQKMIRSLNGTTAQLENSLHEVRARADERDQATQASEEHWRTEKAVIERAFKELEQGYVAAENELHAARASVQELDAERTAHRKAVVQYEATMDHLQGEVDRQRNELKNMSRALSESHTAAHELRELLARNQSELESLRADAAYKGDEVLRLKDQLVVQNPAASPHIQEETLGSEFLKTVHHQHALDLSTAHSQIRSLENTLYQERAKAHGLQRQVSALEDEVITLRTRAPATPHLHPLRPMSAASNVSSSGVYRSTDSRMRKALASPVLSSIDAVLTPETQHKRKVSLSMLKARIDSEREAPLFRHHAYPVLAPMAEESTPTGTFPLPPISPSYSHSPNAIGIAPVENSQFRDEAHVFWCHACSGDLVVL
jgi:predicted  nucleic acid-binding Zn-ribbon protein